MFDCVLATRLGRHGMAFSDDGNLTIKNAKYKSDFSPLKDNCPCFVCRNYTKAYLHHLIKEKEMLGGILLSFHNIVYLNSILEKWKKEKL
jgi:queuine tRNA-ribosyltransferase